MELQDIRIVWVLGLAVLWIVALLVGAGLAALARALDRARDVVAATKQGSETRAGDVAAVVRTPQAAWRLRW
jgi:hypothetical protein